MKRKHSFFVAFEKVEKQDDGTMFVSGVASSEAVDADGETITTEAMKAALPDYMKFGAVREMHQPIAAGTALKCEVGEDGRTNIEAKIVDPTTVMKIEEDVLKGFSVGGRVTSRDPLNKNTITGIKLTEISVVDRPANPEAVFKLGKVEGADEPEANLGELRKGLYSVSRLADLLCSLGWLAQDVTAEAEWEGDNSPVPAALRDALLQLGNVLKEYTSEEVDELLATLPAVPSVEVIQMAVKLTKAELVLEPDTWTPEGVEEFKKAWVDGLAKAGAKFSAATMSTLNEKHQAALEAHDALGKAMGALAECWKDDGTDDQDDAGSKKDDTDKADKAEALQKAAGLEEDLKKAQVTIDTLTKRVQELEKLPAAPKGSITISKGQDITPDTEADEALQKKAEEISKLPADQQAKELIKAIYASHPGGK
jgi:hypothetical protein